MIKQSLILQRRVLSFKVQSYQRNKVISVINGDENNVLIKVITKLDTTIKYQRLENNLRI